MKLDRVDFFVKNDMYCFSLLWQMQALFRIGRGEPPPIPESISKDARDFICKCLQVNPNKRPTAAQLLEHPFVKRPLQYPLSPASPLVNNFRSWKLSNLNRCFGFHIHWSYIASLILPLGRAYVSSISTNHPIRVMFISVFSLWNKQETVSKYMQISTGVGCYNQLVSYHPVNWSWRYLPGEGGIFF